MITFFEVPIEVRVSDQDLEDILTIALEVGIAYWCRQYDRTGKFGITLYATDSDDKWVFGKSDLIRGIKQYITNNDQWSILNADKNGVYVADVIIQYACMGRVISP